MTWQEVIEGANVWVHEYEANSYKANAFAVLLDENSLAIISPPSGMSETDFAAIEAKGKVTALIAPHSGHDLGQLDWQTRYPNAQPYAPTAALNQLKDIGLRPFAPLSKLSSANVEFQEVPGTKKGGTIAIAHGRERAIVYLDELVVNWASLQGPLLVKLMFWLSGSAPGLQVNRVYSKILCTDVSAVAQTVIKALESDPAIVVAHGAPLVNVGDVARVRTLVEPFV